jgi:hypothetical protein
MRIQPAVVEMPAVGALANRDHAVPPNFPLIIHVITTIVKRPIEGATQMRLMIPAGVPKHPSGQLS